LEPARITVALMADGKPPRPAQINKAFAFFGGFVASMFAAINIDPMPFALFIPFADFF
jgi:hypothetical protein